MTLKELSQLYYLRKEIEADQRRLNALKKQLEQSETRLDRMRQGLDGLGSQNLDGMPHGTTVGQKVQDSVLRMLEQQERTRASRAAMLNLQAIISQRQTLCLMERARLEEYITAIPDSLTRQIFTARFIDGLTWQEVADTVGTNTADSVKKVCYRYIKAPSHK